MYMKEKKDHGGPRHLNLSLQWWKQAFKLSFPPIDTLSPFLTQRKTSLSCYSVLSRFPLDRKWKRKNSLNFLPCFFFTFSFSDFSLFWFRNANPFFIFFLLFYSPRWRVTHSDTEMAPWQKMQVGSSPLARRRDFADLPGFWVQVGWFDVAWHNPAKIGGRKHRALFTPLGQTGYWS